MKGLIVIPVILFISFAACNKASGPADGPSIQPNNKLDTLESMSATINGQAWQTDSAFGAYVQQSDNDSGVVNLEINATQKKNGVVSTFVFNITNFSGPETYLINPPVNTATYYVGSQRYFATSGTIVVTSDTGYAIIGYFNFIAGTDTVTNGIFNVALP